MAIQSCGRCGAQTVKLENCNYCKTLVCYDCIKSQKRIKKIHRYYICKSCWTKIPKRKQYKSA